MHRRENWKRVYRFCRSRFRQSILKLKTTRICCITRGYEKWKKR